LYGVRVWAFVTLLAPLWSVGNCDGVGRGKGKMENRGPKVERRERQL